nr:hypothetical protein [Angustibacter aerolatus]
MSSDARSVDPLNLEAARWMAGNLPNGSRVYADRVGGLLASSDGDQFTVRHISTDIDASRLLLDPEYGPEDVRLIRQAGLRYVIVDRRDANGLPNQDVYIENGEFGGGDRTRPVPLAALTKARPGRRRAAHLRQRRHRDLRRGGAPCDAVSPWPPWPSSSSRSSSRWSARRPGWPPPPRARGGRRRRGAGPPPAARRHRHHGRRGRAAAGHDRARRRRHGPRRHPADAHQPGRSGSASWPPAAWSGRRSSTHRRPRRRRPRRWVGCAAATSGGWPSPPPSSRWRSACRRAPSTGSTSPRSPCRSARSGGPRSRSC